MEEGEEVNSENVLTIWTQRSDSRGLKCRDLWPCPSNVRKVRGVLTRRAKTITVN